MFYRGRNDETYDLAKIQRVRQPQHLVARMSLALPPPPPLPSPQQFMFVELTAMQNELKNVESKRPQRSCRDVRLDQPTALSGMYTIDPNLGSSRDAVKTYCDFDEAAQRTCVGNSTAVSQISFLHLLHTHVAETIQLPCASEGPFRWVWSLWVWSRWRRVRAACA